MNNKLRVIKKYPNRRLYDTEISSYVVLEDVKRLVVDEIPIQVIDVRTQEDITYNTLLQIIMESEEKQPAFFSTDILQQMIRFYGGSTQEMFRLMMEQWGTIMTNPTKDPLQAWQLWQQQWMNMRGPRV